MLKNIASFSFPSPPARGFMFLFLIVLPWILAAFGWIGYGLSGFLRMKATNRRKRMAALLTQVLNLPAGDIALMQVDDDALSLRLQQFLALHHIEYPIALYDAEGRYQFRSVEKVRVLAVALLNAVSRARDNELFVLVADLLELDEDIEPLMKTVRTALGRHHQVMLICPWLPKMPTPEQYTPPPLHLQEPPRDIDEIESVLAVIEVTRYHAAYERVRSAFGRLGVTVIRMDAHDTVARILQRLEQLRVLGIRR